MKPFVPQPLPIAELQWEPLIPLIGRANRALAEYNGVLSTLPDPEVLLSPFTTQEAVLSSKIEGTQASVSEVLKFEAGEEPDQASKLEDVREIINYRLALHQAEDELTRRPFNLNMLLAVHSQLLDSVRGRDKSRGRFRITQNWIGAKGCSMEEAQFVPPAPGNMLQAGLHDWERYYHADEPDALVQLAIVHAQFEILHPFLDGNGRLGRILIPLFLHEKRILSRPAFYLSEYLESHRDQYVDRLREIGEVQGAWNRWTVFFLTALQVQAEANVRKTQEIHALYNELKEQVRRLTKSQFAVPLLDAMFRQPIFQGSSLEGQSSMPSKPMINAMLGKLKAAGLLTVMREGSGRRPQVLALAALINLCEGKVVV